MNDDEGGSEMRAKTRTADETREPRSWTRRAFLSGSAAAFVGRAGFSGSSPDRPDGYYGKNSETHTTEADDYRLHASSTAWSLTDEARAEVTTWQYLEPTRRDVIVERIELRSEVEVGDTIRRQTVTYGNIEEATRGFTSRRREFHSYPYWSIHHSVTATVHTESGTIQFDVTYAHSGEELGKLE